MANPVPTIEEEGLIDSSLDFVLPPAAKPASALAGYAKNNVKNNILFSNPNKYYRVIQNDSAFNDLINSGLVRTNSNNKFTEGMSVAEKLSKRPTTFPSFSKGSASMEYAQSNPNHYIIVTDDRAGLAPSMLGRHGKGTTQFPTKDGKHLESIPAELVQVYKHGGNNNYSLVKNYGTSNNFNSIPVEESKKGLAGMLTGLIH